MEFVIGIDLGTSAVKIVLVNQHGDVVQEVSRDYPLIQEKFGSSEQNPQDWVVQTLNGLTEIVNCFNGNPDAIKGISFSGQMHGLVLLDENYDVLRNAILWNDTRTTAECEQIYNRVGKEKLLAITKNPALEGFTLPKIVWVKNHEPGIFEKVHQFVLPKDYLRYRLTGKLHMDYSDAAGTLLLDMNKSEWSKEICEALEINVEICPALVQSHEEVGTLTPEIAKVTGLSPKTRVFAGGADNACGAIGAGILTEDKTLCSIGTSGVILSYEDHNEKNFEGKVHYFNHGAPKAYYSMGVTLAAGYSLGWFKDVFAKEDSFEQLLEELRSVPLGANGLLFTPYLVGERTPHSNPDIRASFIGIGSSHGRKDFVKAVVEGITFSLNESINIFRENGKTIETIVSIGGGAKNDAWLQIQADIFNATIVKLKNEQGPAIGAAMLAAYGCSWYDSLEECAEQFLKVEKKFEPNKGKVEKYQELFHLYQTIYAQTKEVNKKLVSFRM